jgi:hypothetical protein
MKNQEWLTATVWQYPVASVFVPDEHDESAIMISISRRTTGERGGFEGYHDESVYPLDQEREKPTDLLRVQSNGARLEFFRSSQDSGDWTGIC